MAGTEKRQRARTVTKAEVVERVRQVTGLGWTESGDLLEAVLDSMKETLEAGENIKISGFGSFMVRSKSPRRGRNPQTTAAIVIPKRRVLTFKPSQVLRQSLNTGRTEG
ncbi:MAG: integration host factor subunit alpha [Pseudomonadota bacterium]|nr:integration host factor subunit alpha [Pseudomonadota bacterium]